MRFGSYTINIHNPVRVIIVTVVLLVFAFLAYQTLNPSKPSKQQLVTKPIPLVQPIPALLTGKKLATFERSAKRPVDSQVLVKNYLSVGAQPLVFDVYIDQDNKTGNPLFYQSNYTNTKGKRFNVTYIPAQIVPRQSGALKNMLSQSTPYYVVLAFPTSQIPSAKFLRVYGALYWRQAFIDPKLTEKITADASGSDISQTDAPVVVVAGTQPISASELNAPATAVSYPNISYRRGALQITLLKTEVAVGFETRFLFQVHNNTDRNVAGWDGPNSSTLKINGSSAPAVSPKTEGLSTGQSADDAGVETGTGDLLVGGGGENDQMQPNETRTGYLAFAGGTSSQDATLTMPDTVSSEGTGETENDQLIYLMSKSSLKPVPVSNLLQ